jgi:cobalt-zinc-cadmium resistance protein CzcA
VDATIHTVSKNLAEGALLVIVILFLMLRNIRAALITASVIPITMLMTSLGMLGTHTSANLMSLGALDFGLLVDGAVIIIENFLRRVSEKSHSLKRSLTLQERLHEVTLGRWAVRPLWPSDSDLGMFYPFSGVGKMFNPMAITVILALGCAFILSMTFIPAMAALFMKGGDKENQGYFLRFFLIYEP